MITNYTLKEKQEIINANMESLKKNHLCYNYIEIDNISDDTILIEWDLGNMDDRFTFIAFTEYGTCHHDYDFNYSFDENLNTFYEVLYDFIYREYNK